MAAAITPPTLQHVVASAEELVSPQYLGGKGLKVVEVHSWGGPCKSVLPTFKRIRLEKDNEAVLMFVTVDADELQLAQSPAAAGTTTTSSSKSSTTEGLHVILEHAGKSEPLFLFYRNGQLKSKVYGANLPKITANIYEHAVANPEVDDIEDNPFHAAGKDGGRGGASKDGSKGKAKKGTK